MSRPGKIGSGYGRRDSGPSEPTDAIADTGNDWADWWRGWLDVITAPARSSMPLVLLAMLVVVCADAAWLLEQVGSDTAAIVTGIAAVVGSLAAVIEARHGRLAREQLADHEARLRVLEDRGSRG